MHSKFVATDICYRQPLPEIMGQTIASNEACAWKDLFIYSCMSK